MGRRPGLPFVCEEVPAQLFEQVAQICSKSNGLWLTSGCEVWTTDKHF